MLSYLGFILAVVVQTARGQSEEQATKCFDREVEKNQYVYYGDVPSYDLGFMASGPALEFKLKDSYSGAQIQPTFSDYENVTPLVNQTAQKCSTYVHISGENYAYLCDKKLVVFATYDTITGKLTANSSTSFDVPVNSECSTMAASAARNEVYFSCLLPVDPESGNRTLVTFMASGANSSIISSISAQTDPNQGILTNLVLTAYTQTVQGLTSVILYLYEGDETTGMKFHVFKVTPQGKLADGGFFSLGKENILGVAANTNFFQFEIMEDYVFSVARNSETLSLFIQKCLPSPTYGKFTCTNEISDLNIKDPQVKLTVHRPMDRNVDNYWRFAVATTQKLVIFNVNATAQPVTISLFREGDIKSSTITQITDVFTWNERIFLVGKTKENLNSILLYRFNVPNYEQKIFQGESTFDVSFVRRGTYDNDVDEHIGVVGGNTFTSFVYIAQLVMNLNGAPRNAIATVECYSAGTFVNSISINFTVLQTVSGDANIVLPETLEAFVGSVNITVPSSAVSFQGNAPNPSVTTNASAGSTPLVAKIDYARETDDVDYTGDLINDINKFQYIGNNLFAIQSENSITLLKFGALDDQDTYGRDVGIGEQIFSLPIQRGQYFLDAAVRGDFVLLLVGKGNQGLPQLDDSITIVILNIEDKPTIRIQKVLRGYSSAVSVIKVSGSTFDCFFAGYDPTSLTVPKLMLLSITIDKEITDPEPFLTLPASICPTDMYFAPRGEYVLYVASSCGTNVTTRIYSYQVQRTNLNASSISETFSELLSMNFHICPTTRELNVIDLQNNAVFSYDTAGSEDYRVNYPLREYGLDKILDYHCDQENELFQVLAQDSDTGRTVLVTYRAESINQPNTRVHSLRPVDTESKFLASTYNYAGDEVFSIVLSKAVDPDDDEPFTFYRLYTGAPYFYLDASKITAESDVKVTFVSFFEAKDPDQATFVNRSQVLSLRNMPNNVQVKLNSGKLSFPTAQTSINLDSYIQVSGGHVANVEPNDPSNPAISIVNRFSASNQFNNITFEFEQSIMDQNYILGFKNGELVLLENGTFVSSVKVGSLISMDSAGDGTTFYALTLTDPSEGVLNNIYTFLNFEGTWTIVQHTMSAGSYVDMRFFKLTPMQFGYASWRESEYLIEVATLQINNPPAEGQPFTVTLMGSEFITLKDTILDFASAYMQRDGYVLIIASEIQSETSNFYLYKMITDPISKYVKPAFQGGQALNLVPGTDLVPSEVEYDCVVSPFKNLTVDCMHAEINMYSYYVSYTLTPETIPSGKFVTATINKKLVNIVNTKAVRVRLDLNYSAIILQNIAPEGTSFISADYVLAIYAFNYQDTFFRILSPADLGFDNSTSLRDLDPCFFTQAGTNGTKLGLNLGRQSKANSTVKVFNIDGLRLVINKPNELNSNPAIRFFSLKSSTTDIGLDTIFDGIQDPAKKKSHKTLYIILLVVVLLLAIILGVAYKMSRGTPDEADLKETLQETRFDNENTIKAGGADGSKLAA